MRLWPMWIAVCALVGTTQAAQTVPANSPPKHHAHAVIPVGLGEPANSAVLDRVLRAWPEGRIATTTHPGEWSYDEGALLDGVTAMWRVTGDGRLFNYVQAAVDRSVDTDGTIHLDAGAAFPASAHSLDEIEMGRSVLAVYRVLQKDRYYKAAKFLDGQVAQQPKNASGDGAYMAEPFVASYARTFAEPTAMQDAVTHLLLMNAHMRDLPTGLLRHGWDESKQMRWADRKTGLSPQAWGRAMGWYAMALVDVLDVMPANDPQRVQMERLTRRTLDTVMRYQDAKTGLWWQVMDKGAAKGNFPEASASCMFVYSIAKAVRLGVLPIADEASAKRGWAAIQKKFVQPDGTLTGTVKVAGLGGTPYRSGTHAYYSGEPVGDNDAKGVGAYLLAQSEMIQQERAGALLGRARGKVALVDAWFNSQTRKTAAGNEELFHYKWDDDANSGYSMFGGMFTQYGMRTEMLAHAPRAEDLKHVSVYVIVSPDNLKVNPAAHFMDAASANVIYKWVQAGGVLVLMQNDVERADQVHFDLLSDKFGIHFNPVIHNQELNDSYANTLIPIPTGTGGIFKHSYTALMKEICTITTSAPAKPILTHKDDVIMAIAHVGRGVVYANVDPWTYNEYTDGRKNPMGEQNFAGGEDLARWIVEQAATRGSHR